MSLKTKLFSAALAITIAAGGIAGTTQSSSASSLTPAEAAALAGLGGFVIGATIGGSHHHGPYYGGGYYDSGYGNSWGRHVRRCFNRYATYNPRTDTYVGYDGYRHRCRL